MWSGMERKKEKNERRKGSLFLPPLAPLVPMKSTALTRAFSWFSPDGSYEIWKLLLMQASRQCNLTGIQEPLVKIRRKARRTRER